MNQGTHPEELPAEVLDDVASVVGAEVTLLSRLPGGVNGGAMRVQFAGRANAVLEEYPGTPRSPGRDVASPESGRAHAPARLSHPGLARSGGHGHSCMASDGLR